MALLEAHGVSVRFGGHQALRDVSLEVGAGEVVGLIGPNGAGKTTLFNVVSGVQRGDGRVVLDGIDVTGAPPQQRARLGLARTFQRLEVFGSMSVRDNIRVAAECAARARRESVRAATERADLLIELLGLGEVAGQRADAVPTGQARLAELGRALATEPKVLLLDEPASGLSDVETERLAGALEGLPGRGVALLLIEHDIDFLMALSERIYVLHLGEVIATGTPEEIRADPAVQKAYLGAPVDVAPRRGRPAPRRPRHPHSGARSPGAPVAGAPPGRGVRRRSPPG